MPTSLKTLTPAALAHKKVKQKSVNWWKKKAWAVFSKWIRNRDDWTCYTCGKRMEGSPAMHAGHLVSRRNNNTFFDEINVHAQCMYCNMYAYGNTGVYAEKLIEQYGVQEFLDLLKRGRMEKQFSIPELKQIMEIYRL